MSDEEINRAIAEACGWQRGETTAEEFLRSRIRDIWISPSGKRFIHGMDGPPSYAADLNAMHEAERTMKAATFSVYTDKLEGICRSGAEFLPFHWTEISPAKLIDAVLVHATARQRAEAFLKTVGKWKE